MELESPERLYKQATFFYDEYERVKIERDELLALLKEGIKGPSKDEDGIEFGPAIIQAYVFWTDRADRELARRR